MSVKIKKKKTKNQGTSYNLKKSFIISAVVGIIIYCLMLSAAAFIMTHTQVKTAVLPYIYLSIGAVSSFISGLIVCRNVKHKKILVSLASSFIVLILIFIPIIAVNNKDLSINSLLLIPAVILPGMLSSIISK